ncbi:mannonate dehydratase [Candidatus Acetatifactor stercoripullorum]|uniref:mannonate dehydratase n=1 Tax=Candidatus Acetatifactor stercoripullorum TaxID=2838414 RepID=UPI00298E9D8B|nr:mannonate dehydratase [Candidatus Acetatifactor stercoripullorum]
MILTDYLKSEQDITWAFAKQCGIKHGVIRLPEEKEFDVCSRSHWQAIHKKFMDYGIRPIVVEPLPNQLHDHIKAGDEKRDECIEKVIRMLPIMDSLDIRTICFNFMAYVGWCRTDAGIRERGGALVTGFRLDEYQEDKGSITEAQLWENYTYFIKAVMPYARRYGIRFALHPDDPPIPRLGNVSRIMISYENIKKAVAIENSDYLGITMCQACYRLMGEDLGKVVSEMRDKIFFIHFRNVTGNKYDFHETFHDNGDIDMAEMIRLYGSCPGNVPIRVDHVPAMEGEAENTGYTAVGRLYAIGYLRGLMEGAGYGE